MSISFIRLLRNRIQELEGEKKSIEAELEVLREMAQVPQARAALAKLEQIEQRRKSEGQEIRIRPVRGPRSRRRESVWEIAQQILSRVGKPMRLDELAKRIIAEGKQFGGDNPAGSLSAHISQHDKVLGQKDGWAYLVEWPEDMHTGRKEAPPAPITGGQL